MFALKLKLEKQQFELSKKEEELRAQKLSLDRSQKSLDAQRDELADGRLEVERSKKALSQQTAAQSALRQQLDAEQQRLRNSERQNMAQKVVELENEQKALTERRRKYEDDVKALRRREKEFEDKMERIKGHWTESGKLIQQKRLKWAEEKEAVLRQKEKLELDLKAMSEKQVALSRQKVALSEEEQAVEALRSALKEQKQRLQKEKESLRSKSQEMENEVKRYIEYKERADEAKQAMQRDIAQKEEELTSLRQQVAALQEKLDRIASAKKKRSVQKLTVSRCDRGGRRDHDRSRHRQEEHDRSRHDRSRHDRSRHDRSRHDQSRHDRDDGVSVLEDDDDEFAHLRIVEALSISKSADLSHLSTDSVRSGHSDGRSLSNSMNFDQLRQRRRGGGSGGERGDEMRSVMRYWRSKVPMNGKRTLSPMQWLRMIEPHLWSTERAEEHSSALCLMKRSFGRLEEQCTNRQQRRHVEQSLTELSRLERSLKELVKDCKSMVLKGQSLRSGRTKEDESNVLKWVKLATSLHRRQSEWESAQNSFGSKGMEFIKSCVDTDRHRDGHQKAVSPKSHRRESGHSKSHRRDSHNHSRHRQQHRDHRDHRDHREHLQIEDGDADSTIRTVAVKKHLDFSSTAMLRSHGDHPHGDTTELTLGDDHLDGIAHLEQRLDDDDDAESVQLPKIQFRLQDVSEMNECDETGMTDWSALEESKMESPERTPASRTRSRSKISSNSSKLRKYQSLNIQYQLETDPEKKSLIKQERDRYDDIT